MIFFMNIMFIVSQLNLLEMIIISILGVLIVYKMEGKDKTDRVIIFVLPVLLGFFIYVFFGKSTITLSIMGILLILFGVYINILNFIFKLIKENM